MKVFLLNPLKVRAAEGLLSRLDEDLEVVFGPEMPAPADYELLVAGRPDRDHLDASPALKALVIPFAGLPDTTRAVLRDYPHLQVYNLHYNAVPTAEVAIALLLAAAKFLLPFDRDLRKNDWSRRYLPNPSLLLDGKTALILGYGHIGQRVGMVLEALGMRVLAIRRDVVRPLPPGAQAEIHPLTDLNRLLPQAHVVMVTLPLTEETTGLLGPAELGRLPAGSVLVNVGRGAVVDQAALYAALQEGRLAAAGLDVWYNYPGTQYERHATPPADYPFHELDNVVMSPHRGWGTTEAEEVRAVHLAALLNGLARGNKDINQVDLDAGY